MRVRVPSKLLLGWCLQGKMEGVGREGFGVDGGDSTAPAENAPREVVLKAWTSEWAKEGGQIEREKLLPSKGFEVLPRW